MRSTIQALWAGKNMMRMKNIHRQYQPAIFNGLFDLYTLRSCLFIALYGIVILGCGSQSSITKSESIGTVLSHSSIQELTIKGGISKHDQEDKFWSSIHIYDYSNNTEATLGDGSYFEYTCSGSHEIIRSYADVDLPCTPSDTVYLRVIINSAIAYSGYVQLHPTIRVKQNSITDAGVYSISWNFNESDSIRMDGWIDFQDGAFHMLGQKEIDTTVTNNNYSEDLTSIGSDSAFYRFKTCSIHTWAWYGSNFNVVQDKFKSSSLAFSLVKHDSMIAHK
jgi:hypothetical protein